MKNLLIIFVLIFSPLVLAEGEIVKVSPKHCKSGEYGQPQGRFSIFIFCDDGLGTNIAFFLKNINGPFFGNYNLGMRFWQGKEWANDVTSYSWVENNTVVVATSGIYGTGSVYVLSLEEQTSQKIYTNESAVPELVSIANGVIEIRFEKKLNEFEYVTVKM